MPALGFGDGPGGVDEPDVAEGLGEVAEQLTGGGVDFLGQQADVVEVGDGTLENVPCPRGLAGQGQGSAAGRNPTIGIMRLEASRSSEPKYCVKETQLTTLILYHLFSKYIASFIVQL